MSAKLVHVNAKTAWQPIKCPKAEIFDGLLDCHELTYYELAGNQQVVFPSTKLASRKRKKHKEKFANALSKKSSVTISHVEVDAINDANIMGKEAGTDKMDGQSESMDMSSWADLGISSTLLRSLCEEGFFIPTPIQALALPCAIHQHLDVVGAAETGSGKTLAFGLPILQYILSKEEDGRDIQRWPVALIMEPTRELAMQVHKHLTKAARYTGIQITSVVGGMASQKQCRLLGLNPHIIIATPGRLWELIQEADIDHLKELWRVEQLVLDEADRMIENGHFEELHKIISFMNVNASQSVTRQHYIFSATMLFDHATPRRPSSNKKFNVRGCKKKIAELVDELGMKDKPKVIDLTTEEVTVGSLTEAQISCQKSEKDLYLYYILRKYGGRNLVFCSSKNCIRRLVSVLRLLGCNPLPLHSDMHQRQRLKNLDRFTERSPSLLVASDVAARGLDIQGVDHVIHYQVPFTVENYVHRSGRTARASAEGLSVLIVSPDETKRYRNIVKLRGDLLPTFPVKFDVIRHLKSHVALATYIDKQEHSLTKQHVSRTWAQKMAIEAGVEVDDYPLPEEDGTEWRDRKKSLKLDKQELSAILKLPFLPTMFSSRYPTQTGAPALSGQLPTGNAIRDCKQKRKRKRCVRPSGDVQVSL